MSRGDVWMPLYVGDYMADTMHLTAAEHGAYLLLIMHYWRTGPLPDDDKALSLIARTSREDWDLGVGNTVKSFFRQVKGKLRHSRIDKELYVVQARIDQRREAGRASANARWLKDKSNDRITSVVTNPPFSLQRNDTPSPSPSQKKKEIPPNPPSQSQKLDTAANAVAFEEFWNFYPRKDGKGHARKAWLSATRKVEAATIIAGLKRYQFSPDAKFRPMPATWLNGERWEAASSAAPVNGHRVDPNGKPARPSAVPYEPWKPRNGAEAVADLPEPVKPIVAAILSATKPSRESAPVLDARAQAELLERVSKPPPRAIPLSPAQLALARRG